MNSRKRPKDIIIKELIAERYDLPVDAIQLEMLDYFKIVSMGAKKYAMNNWLEPNGKRSSEKDMHDSMGHHWAESMVQAQQEENQVTGYDGEGTLILSMCKKVPKDKESGLDPLLHLACRALMLYTRRQRNIVHPDDEKHE